MVDVTHDSDDRCTGKKVFFSVLEVFESFFFLFFLDLADDDVETHLIRQCGDGDLVDVLVLVGDHTHLKKGHDDACDGNADLFAESCDRDRDVDHLGADGQRFGLFLGFVLVALVRQVGSVNVAPILELAFNALAAENFACGFVHTNFLSALWSGLWVPGAGLRRLYFLRRGLRQALWWRLLR